MIYEQPRQIEQPRHPGHDGNDVEGFDIGKQHVGCQGLSGAILHEAHEPLDILDRRLGADAVAEIEDERA